MGLWNRKTAAVLLSTLLVMQLAGCAQRSAPTEASSETAPSSTPMSSSVAETPPAPEPPKQDDGMLEQAMLAAKPVAERLAEESKRTGVDLTRAQYYEIVDAVAALGVPANTLLAGCRMNLRNHQAVVDFCDAVKAGKDAEVSFFSINIAETTETRFICKDAKITQTTQYWAFAEEKPNELYTYELDDIQLWSNGWMVWHEKDTADAENSHQGIRVMPLDEMCYTMKEEFVNGVVGDHVGVISRNWDADNLLVLNWDYIFEGLAWQQGEFIHAYDASGKNWEHSDACDVPDDVVEAMLTKRFPITVEQLRTLPAYQPDSRTYSFMGFRGGGYSPEYEVIEVIDNPDGSITLRVAATSPEFNQEHLFESMLTILSGADGNYRYISNKTDAADGDERFKVVVNDDGFLPLPKA